MEGIEKDDFKLSKEQYINIINSIEKMKQELRDTKKVIN